MSGQLDLLVLPLRCAVVAGDDPRAVESAEVPAYEGVPGLRFVTRTRSQPEMPLRVLLPWVGREECVLVRGARLHLAPLAADDVLTTLDQLAGASDRTLVHRVGGLAFILAKPGVPNRGSATGTQGVIEYAPSFYRWFCVLCTTRARVPEPNH